MLILALLSLNSATSTLPYMLSLPFALNELHVTMCKAQTKIKPTPLCKMQEDAGPALYQPMTLQEQGLLLLYSDIYLPQPPDLQ